MTTYVFRITCKLAGDNFDIKGNTSLVLPAPTPPIQVMSVESKDQLGNQTLILQGGGFSSEEEARMAGMPVKTAVMLAGLLLGVGIDVGIPQTKPDTKWATTVGFTFDRPVLKRPISNSNLEEKVAKSYAPDKALTKKQTLAAQLYNQSHFQSSDAARFITLISAIEALAEQHRRASATIALVNCMIEEAATAGNLEESERKALTDDLGNLKRESISSACRRLVRTHCGAPAVEAFTRAYGIRGKLLHNGEPPSETNIATEAYLLDRLVRCLVVHHVASSWQLYKPRDTGLEPTPGL
jgi:hypothetical protein